MNVSRVRTHRAAGRGPIRCYAMMAPMTLDPAIGLLMVAAVALLFASAGLHKLRDLRRFDEIFAAYGLVPLIARLRLSWLVPILETGVAAGLLSDACRPYAGAVGIALSIQTNIVSTYAPTGSATFRTSFPHRWE